MKRVIAVLLFLFSGMLATAQSDSIKGNQFTLKGRIINKISLTPDCGYLAFGTVIEFEIIEFSDTSYAKKNIGVIFTCPEFYEKDFFEIGNVYEMKIADENQAEFGWTIPNEKILGKYQLKSKLWVISAKKIE
ncbi:MAG: hypothetical protein M3R17_11350 [Bacteroidota bacterium]|nr:hypothetical protein [Bacteroidota bacterium]